MRGILLTIIVAVAWTIVQSISAARAKKKRAERMRQHTQTQDASVSVETGSIGQTPVSVVKAPTSRSPVPVAASSRLDELAARRKAQLEQLRQKSQQQQRASSARTAKGQAGGVRRISAAVQPPVSQTRGAGRAATKIEEVQASREGVIASGEHSRQRRAAEVRENFEAADRAQVMADERERVVRRQRAVEAARLRDSMSVRERALADAAVDFPATQSGGTGRMKDEGRGRPSRGIFAILQDSASLRRALVLKELLDPPVSLRG